ncbi:IS701 family transposase [Hymenobacter gummosus]|uniref:IS701 family transposase n=1 Tax=Hymenobacter gummosus TaxID=1776032 RepID=A0A431U5B3_9BACT|nr:transposase [Hymenobacter gummosus]RTQ51389.1 IS701 family transposase [Hymenobacter gummosus]
MNAPKVVAEDYIQFLVASPVAVSGTEAARVHPTATGLVAHDSFTRLLHRLEPDAATLWQEAQALVRPGSGVLMLDDTTLDKPYAHKMGLVTRHWSGKHHAVVQSINLLTLLWSDGQRLVPLDCRLYDRAHDHLTKNHHFQHLVQAAHQRGLHPPCVLFDSWYASLPNLKLVRACGWRWLTRLHANRLVNPDGQQLRPLRECAVPADGARVWLNGYGFIRVFRLAAPDGGTDAAQYWASSEPALSEAERRPLADLAWGIEQYHRGLKQCCGVEKAQVRAARAQRNHICCALRAFLRLEVQRQQTGRSWYEAKKLLLREAIRAYLPQPTYLLNLATA